MEQKDIKVEKQHVQLPHRKSEDTITPREQLIYVAIKRNLSKETKRAYVSLAVISQQTGASIPTIRDAIKVLIDLKYLEVHKDGRKNYYTFSDYKQFEPFSYEFLDNKELTFLEKTYIVSSQEYMRDKETGTGVIAYSNRQLSELINMPISTISKCNRSLVAKEFLQIFNGKGKDEVTGCQTEVKHFDLNKFGQGIITVLLNHEDRLAKQEQVSEEIIKRVEALEKENKELKQQYKTVTDENRELKEQLKPKIIMN